MDSLRREIVFLILQFFEEEGFRETAHVLERESGYYFDMKHFEDKVLAGKWDDAETYLTNFTSFDDNRYSTKTYFELRKQKFLEALDRNDRAEALDILIKDLKVFSPGHEDLLTEMTQLLTLNNIREHESLSAYEDANTVRKIVMDDIKKIIMANPLLSGKLEFPAFRSQRLRTLLNQSLNWQHAICAYPRPDPVIRTLLVDHVCQSSSNLPDPVDSDGCSSSAITDLLHFPAAKENIETSLEVLGDHDQISQGCPSQTLDEVTSDIANDLPKTVVQTLKDKAPPSSMDFHPTLHTVLLVGTHKGNTGLWDVISGENLVYIKFGVWNIGAYSTNFKAALEKDSFVSVNRVIWNPDGQFFGVAFSKHIVQLYSYHGGNHVCQHLEVEAHDGSVNDLAFSSVNQQFLVITCGDDKTVKVWDAFTGERCYTFDDHDAPVYSICPHRKEHVHFIFSTSTDGKIKAWLYDTLGPRVDFDAPGSQYTKLAYSADDQRLFSCGTGNDGEPYLVEWDETEGYIKRVYEGLKAPCFSAIQFDTTKNRLLAVGDDYMIKYWDMDNVKLRTSIDVNGGLPARPYIRFNKEGKLLAVTAKGNKIKILAPANYDVSQHRTEIHSVHAPTVLSENLRENENNGVSERLGSNLPEEARSKSNFWNLFEISKPSQCRFLQLPVHPKVDKIVRLSYTNAGNAILALASNGIHLLWKWPQIDQATSQGSPQLWKPKSGVQILCNDIASINPRDSVAVACFAISKNDSYLISTSGGIISLFNMMTFKTMLTFMSPPPKATVLAFYPQDNNILAIGFNDSSILIYNIRTYKVIRKLEGHSQRVTALAFSATLNVLVSADVNGQIFVWNTNGWKKKKGRYLQIHAQKKPGVLSDTHIQFHKDLIHFLAVQHSHLAIYEAAQLTCVNQWVPVRPVVISHAAFSSDGKTVYAGYVDGNFAIFDASNLQPLCRINLTACISHTSSVGIYPVAIAANPKKPTQFAVSLSDGSVYVFEPPGAGLCWTTIPDDEEAAKVKVMGVTESDVN